ncbi:MAG: hypothetical protein KJ000_00560 [Pirellulaceae bacterium]|jgi:hypothetical protein|nr:hypothetical protein [Pirellulaceae bacterium]
MERRVNVIPFESLVVGKKATETDVNTESKRLFDHADVVYAVDGGNERDILIYGKEKLRRIAESDVPEGARVVRVRIRSGQKELERLVEMVRQSKGRHDYAESA